MAILYNSETKTLYKNCNCGENPPQYQYIIFRYGDSDSVGDTQFSKDIQLRRRYEKTLPVPEQAAYRRETSQMRQERRGRVETARRSGFVYGNPYYTSLEVFAEMDIPVHKLTDEELDNLGNAALKEYMPKKQRRFR